jgi:hypothetical protein
VERHLMQKEKALMQLVIIRMPKERMLWLVERVLMQKEKALEPQDTILTQRVN